jgi:hypothetical protein
MAAQHLTIIFFKRSKNKKNNTSLNKLPIKVIGVGFAILGPAHSSPGQLD